MVLVVPAESFGALKVPADTPAQQELSAGVGEMAARVLIGAAAGMVRPVAGILARILLGWLESSTRRSLESYYLLLGYQYCLSNRYHP